MFTRCLDNTCLWIFLPSSSSLHFFLIDTSTPNGEQLPFPGSCKNVPSGGRGEDYTFLSTTLGFFAVAIVSKFIFSWFYIPNSKGFTSKDTNPKDYFQSAHTYCNVKRTEGLFHSNIRSVHSAIISALSNNSLWRCDRANIYYLTSKVHIVRHNNIGRH